MTLLQRIAAHEIARVVREPVDRDALEVAAHLVEDVRRRGEAAVQEHARRLDGHRDGDPLVLDRHELERAREALAPETGALLERTAARIRRFARAQLGCHPLPHGQRRHRGGAGPGQV